MELIRVTEAAKLLAISPREIRRLVSAGKLTAYYPASKGKALRLLRSQVEGHIDACARESNARAVERRKSRINKDGFDMLRSLLPKSCQN